MTTPQSASTRMIATNPAAAARGPSYSSCAPSDQPRPSRSTSRSSTSLTLIFPARLRHWLRAPTRLRPFQHQNEHTAYRVDMRVDLEQFQYNEDISDAAHSKPDSRHGDHRL